MAQPPLPTTDFAGSWVIDDGNGNSFTARIRYSAANHAMRLELSPGGSDMHAVRDMKSGEIVLWSSDMPGMGMRLATPTEMSVTAEPTGERLTINGEECETWRIEGGTACLASDNVPLRTQAEGVTVELEEIERAPQDASLFQPPDGLNIISIRELGGLNVPGLELPPLPF